MRPLRALAFVALAAGAFASAAFAGGRSTTSFVDCGTNQLSILFWPLGHQAVPGVKFGPYPIPHTEIYRPDPAYPNANFLAFFDSGGQVSIAKTGCPVATLTGTPTATVSSATTITTTSTVNCTFPQAAQFEIVGTPNTSSTLRVVTPVQTTASVRVKVRVTVKGKKKFKFVMRKVTKTGLTTVLTEQVAASFTTLTYDSKFCVASPPPS